MLSLEPVVALLAGVLLLSQAITPLRVTAAVLVVVASAGVTLTARSRSAEGPQPVDEAPGWELPTPTHATLTGEMPMLTADDLREDGSGGHRQGDDGPGGSGSGPAGR
jgi:inner membrane transporter RhtA